MEYEVKIKMVQEQWLQLKMKFLLVYNMKFVIKWGEWTLGGVGGGGFLVGGMSKGSASREGLPQTPNKENPVSSR